MAVRSAAPRRWASVAAVAVAVLGAVWAARFVLAEGQGDAAAEAGFAKDMSAHHTAAIEMADVVVAGGADPEIVALAREVAA